MAGRTNQENGRIIPSLEQSESSSRRDEADSLRALGDSLARATRLSEV